jgi:hypothetical protein
MVDHHHWQLDGSAPELYQGYLVPAITTKWAEDIVGRAQPRAGLSHMTNFSRALLRSRPRTISQRVVPANAGTHHPWPQK